MEEGISVSDHNVGEITWSNVPGQEFVPAKDRLCGIEIMMATFARVNTCRVEFRLFRFQEGNKEELRVVEKSAAELQDNSWHTFRFQTLSQSAGSILYFLIESPDGEAGNAITLWANSSISRPGYQMHLNHQPVPGGICFNPIYFSPVDEAARAEWEEWGKWEHTARAMVDGSPSEEHLRARGRWAVEFLTRALSINKAHRVLEIGAGVGRLSREMAPLVDHLTCTDISSSMLTQARKRLSEFDNVSFIPLGEKSLHEFDDRSYDRIYCHLVFFHLPREVIYDHLCQIGRLLAPGGMAYFDTWNLCHPDTFKRWQKEVDMYVGKDRPLAYNRFHTRMEMDLLVEKAGLRSMLVAEAPLLCYVTARKDDPVRFAPEGASPEEIRGELCSFATGYLPPDGD